MPDLVGQIDAPGPQEGGLHIVIYIHLGYQRSGKGRIDGGYGMLMN